VLFFWGGGEGCTVLGVLPCLVVVLSCLVAALPCLVVVVSCLVAAMPCLVVVLV
jgi:hypothetical protein